MKLETAEFTSLEAVTEVQVRNAFNDDFSAGSSEIPFGMTR